ncbi:hypothetical protein AAVH_30362 [Aphelenchoides avenae]|nr:hypothetical protein AAVH_30362 [Aphelenchus avenae]
MVASAEVLPSGSTNGFTNGYTHAPIEVDLNKPIDATKFNVGDVVALMNGSHDSEWYRLSAAHVLKDVTTQQISIGFLSFVAKINFLCSTESV